MRATDPVAIFLVILVAGIAAGVIFDRFAGPSWLARQFAGATRGLVTGSLVGIAGAAIGYHLASIFGLVRTSWIVLVLAAVLGAAVILWAWRMVR
jgi:uncharacterized membrane protein YeaQ/YmgE (transglycosylase-associated protein family)